ALRDANVDVYAQDLHWEERGAFTGQVAVSMVRGLAVGTIVGHSEVRRDFGDTDERVAKKLARAVTAGLRPVLCVGESAAEHAAGEAAAVVAHQIAADVAQAERRGLERLVIAYEPVWAIGTGNPATGEHAMAAARAIRAALKLAGLDAEAIPVLYGGSVSRRSVRELAEADGIEAARGRGTLHLMGLVSTGGVHADMKHLAALAELARREKVENVVVHAFLDGRDMPPRSALELIPRVPARIATVHGRYYAMDRDKRWDRVERSYRAIVDAEGPRVPTAEAAPRKCYAQPDCRDELLEPHIVGEGAPIRDGDAAIFFNFRPDRARELTWALMKRDFDGFERTRVVKGLPFVTLTDYKVDLPDVRVAF